MIPEWAIEIAIGLYHRGADGRHSGDPTRDQIAEALVEVDRLSADKERARLAGILFTYARERMSDTLEQPSAYGKQPPSVGATGTGPMVRLWKDCPTCKGTGKQCRFPKGYQEDTNWSAIHAPHSDGYVPQLPYGGAGVEWRDCPTCAAHWAGVDEAVTEYDRRLQAEERKAERAERITSDLLPGATRGNR